MIRKVHQTQFPDTPLFLTMSVTKLGVSVENVVATMDTPNNHQGIFRPDRKNSLVEDPALLETQNPINSEIEKKVIIMAQSIPNNSIFLILKHQNNHLSYKEIKY